MAPHAFNCLDAEVTERVASAGKMSSYRFLGPPVQDVVPMAVQADVEGVLRLAHILLAALPAFDEVDNIARLAGGRGASVVASPGGCAPDGCPRLHVVTGEAAPVATSTAPTCWLEGWWLEVRAHQKVPKVLWSAVGNDGALWGGILQASGGMEHRGVVPCDGW